MPIEQIMSVFLMLALSVWGARCLHTGLYGLIKKRPLLRSSRWGGAMLLVVYVVIAVDLENQYGGTGPWRFALALGALIWITAEIVQLIYPSYVAVGVAGNSLHTAVYAALDKLGLEVEVKGGVIRIPSEQLSIWVSRPLWGWATMRLMQRSGNQRLRQIAGHVAQGFKASEVEVDNTIFVLNVVLGLGVLGLVVWAFITWS